MLLTGPKIVPFQCFRSSPTRFARTLKFAPDYMITGMKLEKDQLYRRVSPKLSPSRILSPRREKPPSKAQTFEW